MKCPLCNSNSTRIFEIKGFQVLDCEKCKHRFAEISADEQHVSSVYDDTYFNGGGAGYGDYFAEGELLRTRGQMYANILSKHTETGKILDVGAAAGFILQGLTDENWNGIGLEPNVSMVNFGRKNLNLDIRQGSLETFQTNEKFDVVSMIQVAAHLYEPNKAFEIVADLLKENGLLLIETWNRESFSARIFGKNWHEYSPPSVLQWFSLNGLSAYLTNFGFEKVAHGRPSKKISGEHAKSLLRYRLGNNFLLNLIPDKLNFPYPSEDLFWAIYRKH
jgi:2-polyprenyl-3-methyl-5-hydroxy-6-metoxy-1,4-benzoquinol methylase